jgi:biopolymer transport protein ExbB/TolQ
MTLEERRKHVAKDFAFLNRQARRLYSIVDKNDNILKEKMIEGEQEFVNALKDYNHMIDRPDHYPDIDPWKLQEHMESSGDAYVDARRCDAIKYAFRKKESWLKDLRKARNCIDAAIKRLEEKDSIQKEWDKVPEQSSNRIKIGDTVHHKNASRHIWFTLKDIKPNGMAVVAIYGKPIDTRECYLEDLVKVNRDLKDAIKASFLKKHE